MLGHSASVRVWARSCPTDLRLGYRGLAALVEQEFHRDVRGGDLFLFVNRRRTSAKVLLWDGSGLCVHSERPARGHFARLWQPGEAGQPLRLDTTELNLFRERATRHREADKRRRR